MSKTLQRSFYILFSLFTLYCLLWYSWGIYIKKIIHSTLSNQDQCIITTDKIELAGFPLSLNYSLRNLLISCQDGIDNITINLGNPHLKSNLMLSDIALAVDNEVSISLADSKHYYSLKYEHGASLEVKLQQPYGYNLLNLHENKAVNHVNIYNIAQIKYKDLGYSIRDTILKKIVFISPKNNFDLSIVSNDNYDDVAVITSLSGEGSDDSLTYTNGIIDLEAKFDVKLFFASKNRNSQMEGIAFDFENFTFTTKGYNLSLTGKLSAMNSSQDSTGALFFVVNNVPNFLNAINQVFSTKHATFVKGLLAKMAGVELDQILENTNIEIAAKDKTIKFGNATIVDLMLYSVRH